MGACGFYWGEEKYTRNFSVGNFSVDNFQDIM
jgi:hypothetical protein